MKSCMRFSQLRWKFRYILFHCFSSKLSQEIILYNLPAIDLLFASEIIKNLKVNFKYFTGNLSKVFFKIQFQFFSINCVRDIFNHFSRDFLVRIFLAKSQGIFLMKEKNNNYFLRCLFKLVQFVFQRFIKKKKI